VLGRQGQGQVQHSLNLQMFKIMCFGFTACRGGQSHSCITLAAHCRALDEHTNFERFWMALLVLLRVATADNWADVFRACMVKVSRWSCR
jgi:hypothetical protein